MGQNSETEDPVASAWLYFFGQFVNHDLALEQTRTNSEPINIIVPPGDPVFVAGIDTHGRAVSPFLLNGN